MRNMMIVVLLMWATLHSAICQVFPTVTLSNSVLLATPVQYSFVVNRPMVGTIPAGSTVQVALPSNYDATFNDLQCGWGANNVSDNCKYESRIFQITDQFTSPASPFSLSFSFSGIRNPAPAATYTLTYRIINGATEIQKATVSVAITMGAATSCSINLSSCRVFQQCSFNISYSSGIVSSLPNTQAYYLEMRMSESYPADSTNTDIQAAITGSTSTGLNYQFQIPYQNSFQMSMLMPPSTESVPNFIYLKTFASSGSYDYCYLNVGVSSPNSFTGLTFSTLMVQESSDLTITFTPNTPIVFGDQIQLDFSSTSFNISQVTAANFSRGTLDEKPFSINAKVLTIYGLMTDGSPPIQGEVIFTLKSIIAPTSNAVQQVKMTTLDSLGFKRDQITYGFIAQTGTLLNSAFICSSYEIGSVVSCSISARLGHSLPATGSLQVTFPASFSLTAGILSCSQSGGVLNASPTCAVSAGNILQISGLSGSNVAANTAINVTIPLTIPNSPGTFTLGYQTLAQDQTIIDTSSASVTSVSRKLINAEILMSFDTVYTSTEGLLTINIAIPLAFPDNTFSLQAGLALREANSVRQTTHDKQVSYTYPDITVSAAVGTTTTLTLTDFLTPASTKPLYISGKFLKDGVQYFYFQNLRIAMSQPSQFAIFTLTQSNQIVGTSFIASLSVSGLNITDYLQFPTQWYANNQSNCSSNSNCQIGGKVIITQTSSTATNEIMVNMVNPTYFSSQELTINSYDSQGYIKQTKNVTIRAQQLNTISVVYSQTQPYFQQQSLYRVNLTLFGTLGTSRFVDITVPVADSQYVINSVACTLGCTVGTTNGGIVILTATSTSIRVTLNLTNPSPSDTNSFTIQFQSRSNEGLIDQGSLTFSPSCQLPCRSCSTNSTTCSTCYNWLIYNKYREDTKTCVSACDGDQYCETVVTMPTCRCQSCPAQCTSCTSPTVCQSCSPTYFLYNSTCGSTCPSRYYTDSISNQCVSCSSNCLTCTSTNVCTLCSTDYFLYQDQCVAACPSGTYSSASGTSKICIDCANQCRTCTSSTVCTSCQSSYTLYSSRCLSQCPSGQYIIESDTNGTVSKVCAACQSPCNQCELSMSSCTSCRSGYRLFPDNSTCLRNCPQAYYYSSTGNQCLSCHSSCSSCTSSADTACLACVDPSHYLQLGKCVALCQTLHPNNDLMICQACRSPCLQCTVSTTCQSCITNYNYLATQNKCYRTCPSTYYADQGNCILCSDNSNCQTCRLEESIICTSCITGYVFYGDSCITIADCVSPNTVSSSYCLSPTCQALSNCLTCSQLRCLECQTNYTLTSSNQCTPIEDSSKEIAAVSELPVPFPFVIASVAIIVIAFLIRVQYPKMFAPLFIYAFMGIAEAGLLGLWIALIYLRSVEDTKLGDYLKLAATVICLVYCGINVLAFFFYLLLVRKDRKYRLWEKQDNLCASVTITIVALLISFRFGVLKYSKLAHSQKFSATVAADSKISHQNIFAFLSIGIISVPAIVVSAWVSYLQTTMNYLFFTSMEVTVFSIIMIIVSILQSFSPKGYAMENKADYKQGHDQHNIEGESLDQVMMGIDVVEEEYHEGKEIDSREDEVGQGNNPNEENEPNEEHYTSYGTSTAFMYHTDQANYTGNDEKLQFEDIAPQRVVFDPIDERDELENILIEAEKLAQKLEQPSRPVGVIRRQYAPELFSSFQSSQGVQSSVDEEEELDDLAIDGMYASSKRKKKNSTPITNQNLMPIQAINEAIEMGERKIGMSKLKMLFEQLQMKEAEQRALSKRLEQVTQQEKNLKQKQYERTRQAIQRSQMALEDKMGRIQGLFSSRLSKEEKRKQKIKKMEVQRKKQREQRKKQTKIQNLIYPPPEDIEVELIQVKQRERPPKGRQSPEKQQYKWDQDQKVLNFEQNNEWRITEEEVEHQTQKGKLPMDQPQELEQIGESHWPLDPQLQAKIAEVEERAEQYMKSKRKGMESFEDYGDSQLFSSSAAGEDLVYMEDGEEQEPEEGQEQHKQIERPVLQIQAKVKLPKFRANRDVINLSPE